MNKLVPLHLRDHVAHRCKASTAKAYRRLVGRFILPAYGPLPVEKVDREVIASRLTISRIMRSLPAGALSVKRYKENKRERFLSPDETERLGEVLREVESEMSSAVAAFRLLLLTGCRLSEIQFLRWEVSLRGRPPVAFVRDRGGCALGGGRGVSAH